MPAVPNEVTLVATLPMPAATVVVGPPLIDLLFDQPAATDANLVFGANYIAPRDDVTVSAATTQPSFDFEATATTVLDGSTPTTAILGFLGAHDGWHAKADVLTATGITDGQWNAAIADLIAGSRVERQGERRGARYRIQPGHRDDHHEGAS